ncbi:hypothetical protein PAK_P100005 [Pseudomonas phage PAK_P1]|uniref:Head decoration protein n=9 Tax=Viruses TaxID=10239 RepID=D4N440_9CAUD|nr:hypothetical protein PAK_P100005 [Pseudomonas phage PAK_P1]YP_007236461.1 structural protein [Pseudomonas phage PaP1]YP_009186943.1 hypothetical protein AU075_gp167 [Pseudomonas phage C11]YP_009199992.1 hypothetical protein K8_056 [Pseudomonas phage K8]YP_009273810.1 hypothetical protein BH773_gp173 [Pseudomonas phage K5]YP_009598035.1 hypothetical protein FDH20_gp123 [Pseudomonas phage PA10]YP_009598104.1 putative head decoration protein [Pseudomonas phage Zigelbrucke]YP_010762001.1 hypo
MAQNIIAKDHQRLSNWLKEEQMGHRGLFYTRETLPVADIDVKTTGSVLDSTGKLVTKATIADATYILMTDLHDYANAQMSHAVVLARGFAKIGSKAVIFGADVDDADKATVFEAFKAKNIFAVDQIEGAFENVTFA